MIHLPLLIVSIIGAGLETGLSYVLLEVYRLPPMLTTGILFGAAMLIIFLAIIIIGLTMPSLKLADYVRRHFGRTLVLMLAAVLLMGGLGIGLEAVYQLPPMADAPKAYGQSDICFVVDFSASMTTEMGASDRRQNVCDSLVNTIRGMSDSQRVSIVCYGTSATTAMEWTGVDASLRDSISAIVDSYRNLEMGGTSFDSALIKARELAEQSRNAGKQPALVFMSDGESQMSDASLTYFIDNSIPVHTIFVSNVPSEQYVLERMSSATGGSAYTVTDQINLSVAMSEVSAGVEEESYDTLLTASGRRQGIIPLPAMRIVLLILLGFALRYMGGIMMGRNKSLRVHALGALVCGVVGAAVVEVGFMLTAIPAMLVVGAYWLINIVLIGRTD